MLSDEGLRDACGVAIAFTGRDGGASTGMFDSLNTSPNHGDDPVCVSRNHALVLDALGCPEASLVIPQQVHGSNIVFAKADEDGGLLVEGELDAADAVVVTSPRIAALLNFADCASLILVAPTGHFSVAHAGWRGTVAGVASKAARALASVADCPTDQLNAYIGPHIGPECFEVGEDVARQFVERFDAGVLADERHVSLFAAVSKDLRDVGVDERRIVNAGICTVCNADRFFSYRATEGQCGRHAAVACRVGDGR